MFSLCIDLQCITKRLFPVYVLRLSSRMQLKGFSSPVPRAVNGRELLQVGVALTGIDVFPPPHQIIQGAFAGYDR